MIKVEERKSLEERMNNLLVLEYKNILKKKKVSLFLKRAFDIIVSLVLIIILSPVYLIIAIAIKCDSRGKVIYKQERITKNGKIFYIYKFRTMVENADKIGSLVTVSNDNRVTKVGKILRKFRLDETSQLINILKGEMSFVGTRPEVYKYVERYTDEMFATLLLPAGVTSLASIYYKDEEQLLNNSSDTDDTYVNEILPQKMYYNLKSIKNYSFWGEIKIMFMTVLAVLGKEYSGDHFPEKNEKMESV